MISYHLLLTAVTIVTTIVAVVMFCENLDISREVIELRSRARRCRCGEVEAKWEPGPTEVIPNRKFVRPVWN